MPASQGTRPVTIAEVAAAAGVSRATVSRVANGRSTVDRVIAERVERAIAELNYRPSATARNLSLGRTHTVAVVIPDMANPMFQAVLRGVTRSAAGDGYRVLIADSQEDVETEQSAAVEARMRCDALVLVAPRMEEQALKRVLRDARPAVLVNRPLDDEMTPQIGIDYVHAMGLLVTHLVELGHRHIVYLGGPERSASNLLRLEGLAAAERENPDLHVERILVGSGLDDGFGSAERVLESGATAAIAFNDLIAFGLLNRLHDLDIDVPGQLSVAGFDDIPFARFGVPPLTTIAVPQDDLGSIAWSRLRSLIDGVDAPPPTRLRGRLVVRESTGPVAR